MDDMDFFNCHVIIPNYVESGTVALDIVAYLYEMFELGLSFKVNIYYAG